MQIHLYQRYQHWSILGSIFIKQAECNSVFKREFWLSPLFTWKFSLKGVVFFHPFAPPNPLRPLLPTFSCGYHIPDSHSHDKHRFMHSALISQQVILWSYAPFGANFLQETNGGFARRNQCHLAGYLKHMLNIISKLIAM